MQRYRQRLSGPLLDRINLTLEVARLPVEKLARDEHGPAGEASSVVKARVMAARAWQYARNVALAGRDAVETGGRASVPAGGGGGFHAAGGAGAPPADSGTTAVPGRSPNDNQTELTDFTGDAGALAQTAGGAGAPPADRFDQATGGRGGSPHHNPSGAGLCAGGPAAHGCTNAALTSRQVKAYCALSEPCQALLMRAAERLGLSARAYERIRKVARTIADLAGSESIEVPHLAEAIQYRSGEERLRG